MLSIHKLNSPVEREKYLQDFDSARFTWVVSDLKSKLALQDRLLQRNGYFENTEVLRANELWSLLLQRTRPEIQIVSREFILASVAQMLKAQDALLIPKQSEGLILEMMDHLPQVWSHPVGYEMLRDWWQQFPLAEERWGTWATLAFQCAQTLLNQKKISGRWIASYLSNVVNTESNWQSNWQKNLIVDLGAELTRPETELLSLLAKSVDVLVLQPALAEKEKFNFLLKPYEEFQNPVYKSAGLEKPLAKDLEYQKCQVKRLTSPLAEVKFVTSEIRQLLDNGVAAHEIAVIAPEVESYWPLLHFYFNEEGIPCNKDQATRLQSIPAVAWWISRLRLAIANFEYSDLENANYMYNPQVNIRFEKFAALFKNILESEDLARHQSIDNAFHRKISPQKSLSMSEFLGFAASFWNENANVEFLEIVMQEILKNSRSDVFFDLSTWLLWLEQIIAKIELTIEMGHPLGVQICNLLMADQTQLKYRYFLGLTDDQFKSKKMSLISLQETEQIYKDLGFHLAHQELSLFEFELRWLLLDPAQQNTLCFPMTDMQGQETTPHPIWMEFGGEKHHAIDEPLPTRHDLLQRQEESLIISSRFSDLPAQAHAVRLRQIHRDLSVQDHLLPSDYFAVTQEISLSASSLESFQNCAFQFAASKVFRLLDPAEADLDSSAMTAGNLVHALLEELSVTPRRFDYTEVEIAECLEGIYQKLRLEMQLRAEFVGDQFFWPALKKRISKIALRFLEYERQQATPLIQLHAREKKFSFRYQNLNWRGVIDRIDILQEQGFIVYDYKPKNRSYEFTKWSVEKKMQVGFYAWAIQQKLIEGLAPQDVVGAQYYIYQNLEKKGVDPLDPEAKQLLANFYVDLQKDIQQMSEALQVGNFPANPRDQDKSCQYCKWSQVCRAPHLMR